MSLHTRYRVLFQVADIFKAMQALVDQLHQ